MKVVTINDIRTYLFCPHLYELGESLPQSDLYEAVLKLTIHRFLKTHIGTVINGPAHYRSLLRTWTYLFSKHFIEANEKERLIALSIIKQVYSEYKELNYRVAAVNYPLQYKIGNIDIKINIPAILTDEDKIILNWIREENSTSRQQLELIRRIATSAILQSDSKISKDKIIHATIEVNSDKNMVRKFIDNISTPYHLKKTDMLLLRILSGMKTKGLMFYNMNSCMKCPSRRCEYGIESNNPRRIFIPWTE